MRGPGGRTALGAGLLAVIALASAMVLAFRGTPSGARDTSAPRVTETAGQTGGLLLTAETLHADGGQLSLQLAVRNSDAGAVVVTSLQGAGPSLTARLPRGGVRIAGGGRAPLTFDWAGPDCATDPPDRVVDDLTYSATDVRGATTDGTVVTGAADDLLQRTWRDTCEGADVFPTGG